LYSQDEDPNSVNAQKKAAKKAAAKAKKQAIKSGDAPPTESPPEEAAAAPATAAASTAKTTAPPEPPKQAAPTVKPVVTTPIGITSTLAPLQVAINPNLPLIQRPVVALSVAVITNTVIDLDIISDHRRPHACMGLEQGGLVTGDLSMARYLVRRSKSTDLLPTDPAGLASVEAWMDYGQSLMLLPDSQRLLALSMTLEQSMTASTYVAGPYMTLADLALFAVSGFPTQVDDYKRVMESLPPLAKAARRWIELMAQHPALQQATQLCVGIANNAEASFQQQLDPLALGMNTLEGAIPGRVVTRFPPEPSGYLHIGHAKAVLLNDYYARRYKGRLLLRFDDTNPSKEKAEFEESIVVDLSKLGVKPDSVSYTSDYFGPVTGYAKRLIEKGLAFMDDTPQEQMKIERGERKESKHRNQSPEEALRLFDVMCSGSENGSAWCLRAKIDMQSDNGTMRDPVLFRQNLTPHHRSGTKYKAYPTYDLACPIVDSLEGVTHALRTTEYNDRDEQYQWILKALGLRRVRIHAFSRVNFVNTVLSKRKLTWFVENGYVTGWDDARFPTVRGVVRRGINIAALRNFMYSQGASRRVVNLDWSLFWAENKKEIDKTAKRFMAIDKAENVKLTITNGPKEEDYAYIGADYHPKDPSLGSRVVRIASKVILEKVDVEGVEVGEDIVLLRWGVVKLTKVGDELEGEYVPDGDFKAAKRKLSWLADVVDSCPVVLTE
jgi:glutamyl-tRNA synthetase